MEKISKNKINEIALKGIRKLPKGVTLSKLKAHIIEPANIKDFEFDDIEDYQEVEIKIKRHKKKKYDKEDFERKASTIDVVKFGEKLHAKLKDEVTGYVMALNYHGNLIYNTLWQFAQTPKDKNQAWSIDTQMHIASISKFLTAVGLVKLLDKKGIDYDEKIINYLPSYWKKGNNIEKITFRHLLTHKSGLDTEETSKTNYNFMKQEIAEGVSEVGNYLYANVNFCLMRILMAIINGDVDKNTEFHPYSNINDAMWDGFTILAYKEYMQDNVFSPAGITNAGFEPSGTIALGYNFPHQNQKGWDSGDLSTASGGAGWRLTPRQLLTVMNHVRRKNTIISSSKAQYMLDNLFGINKKVETDAGMIYHKSGRWRNKDTGRQVTSVAYFFPQEIEVVVFVNSPIGTDKKKLWKIVRDSFLESLKD